jgi:hypothetical protein
MNDTNRSANGPAGGAGRPAPRPAAPAKPGSEGPPPAAAAAEPRRTTGSSRVSSGRIAAGSASGKSDSRRPSRESAPEGASRRHEPTDEGEHRPKTRTHSAIETLEKSDPKRVNHIVIGLMVALILAAGISAYLAYASNKRHKDEVELTRSTADAAMEKVRNALKNQPTAFDANIKLIDEQEEAVKLFPAYKSELANSKADMTVQREAESQRKKNLELLVQQETDVQDTSKLESVKRMIPNLEMAAQGNPDPEYAKRVAKIKSTLALNSLRKLSEEARAAEAAAGNDLRAAAAAYDTAIAKIREQLSNAPGDAEAMKLFKDLIVRSDDIVGRLVTPEYEAGIPVRDMLTPKEARTWDKTEGARHQLMGREMVLTGEKVLDKDGKERKINGLVSLVGWKSTDPWYDVVINLEFTIVSGKFDMFLRFMPKSKYSQLSFDPNDPKSGYKLNTPYKMTIKIIGSRMDFIEEGGAESVRTDQLKPDVSRVGGLAFALDSDTKLTISNCTVKVLRPQGSSAPPAPEKPK